MADEGHLETEKLLKDLEKRIAKEYKQAVEETQAKLDDYMRRFKTKDLKWQEWVEEGKKTKEEYKQWRVGQIAVGKRWEAMKEQLAKDYHNTNVIARSIMDGYMPEIYAINHNFAAYDVEHELSINTSYTLYDRQTAERLIRDNPDMLPPPGKKVAARIAEGKDILWNKQQIQSVMMQSLLQGESIPNIADRLALEVGDSNYKAAIRNARTMTTGAQNAGRVDGYKRAQDMGIELRQTWVATLDNRTRHSHRQLDGETVDIGTPFKVDGYEIMFPGDPSAPAHLVYNCRCTLIGQIKGFERDVRSFDLRNDPDVSGMTYEEWKNARKSESNSITLSKEKGEAIAEKYREEYRSGQSSFEKDTHNFKDIQSSIENAYEYHRINNNLNSVPASELKGTGALMVDYGNLSETTVEQFNETIDKLIEKYDTPLQRIRLMKKEEYIFSDAFASSFHNYSVDSAEILINPKKCNDYGAMVKRIAELSKNGYAVKIEEGREGEYIPTHEFAHTLLGISEKLKEKTNFVNANYSKIKEARSEINALYSSYLKDIQLLQIKTENLEDKYAIILEKGIFETPQAELIDKELKTCYKKMEKLKISDYSLIDADEFLAEAFTQYEIGTPSLYSEKVMEILLGYFGR